jgi:hypothetical protein
MVVQTPSIVQYGTVDSPARPLFLRLRGEFVRGQLGPYRIVSSDARTRTLVVRRDSVDSDHWTKWSYCKVGPLDMLDSLRDGTVTMTISLEPAGGVTNAAVAADFEGQYSLTPTSASETVRCGSRGVLEKELLTTIAAAEMARPRRVTRR